MITKLKMLGIDNKRRIKEKGITLLEAMIATAIVGIGFIAVFQMVNYSVHSINISGERTKINYLSSMVAEDVIGDRFSRTAKNEKLYEHLADLTDKNSSSFYIGKCFDKSAHTHYNAKSVAIENKISKWDSRLSGKRIKCIPAKGSSASNPDTYDYKLLKVYEICKDKVKTGTPAKARPACHHHHDDAWNPIYIGRMEINMNSGQKTQVLYFPVN
tara:strand:+ start:7209 stop:7853 length:645 start_codon:yes stop_codon:yes gene_type:complete